MERDLLFLGLTRPTMLGGVTYSFFIINAMLTTILFLGSGKLLMMFGSVPIHLVGYLICLRDPRSFDVLLVKFKKCMQCRNRRVHRANSYDPY